MYVSKEDFDDFKNEFKAAHYYIVMNGSYLRSHEIKHRAAEFIHVVGEFIKLLEDTPKLERD